MTEPKNVAPKSTSCPAPKGQDTSEPAEQSPISGAEFKDFFVQAKEIILADHEEVLETFRELKDQSFNSPNLEVSHETRAQLAQLANVLANLNDKMVKIVDIAADFVRPKKTTTRVIAPKDGAVGNTTNNIIITQPRRDMLNQMEEVILQQQAETMSKAVPIIIKGVNDRSQESPNGSEEEDHQ